MKRPPLRVLTAAWPSPEEPRRARFLEDLHRQASDRWATEVLVPRIYSDDPSVEERVGMSITRFPTLSSRGPVRSRRIGLFEKATYVLSMDQAARQRWPRDGAGAGEGCVLAHWIVPAGAIAAGVARRLSVPLVLYAHGSDVNRYALSGLGRRALRHALSAASLVFAASEALRAKLLPELPEENPPRVAVLPMGIDPCFEPAEEPPAEPNPLRVLFVGDPIASKGARRVARAVERCLEEGLSVELTWIGGEGTYGPPSGVGVRRGNLTAEEVAEEMRRAHRLLLPSDAEGTPLVLQEAIASALPWSATPVGGIPALAEQAPGGTLLPAPSDEAAVVDAIVAQLRQDITEGDAGVRRRHAAMVDWPGRRELTVPSRADRFCHELEGVLRWAS